jgi:excisionase family DNA binding protein
VSDPKPPIAELGQRILGRTTDLLTSTAAAEYLGVAPNTLAIWRCNKRYEIPYIKVGSHVRYRRDDLDVWLASRTVGAPMGVAA